RLSAGARRRAPRSSAFPYTTLCRSQLDLRYAGQQWTIGLPFAGDDLDALHRAFDDMHLRLYGSSQPDAALEAVGVRVAAYGLLPPLQTDAEPVVPRPVAAPLARRRVHIGSSG